MQVYAGSQNASRIAGHFVYPKPRYSTAPIEPIEAVRARQTTHLNRIEELNRLREENRLPASPTKPNEGFLYTNLLFRNPEFAQKGLFLNILG